MVVLPKLFVSVQKIFTVPSTAEQMKIPFARVNHAKYMVTDRVVYIGMLFFIFLNKELVIKKSACLYFNSMLINLSVEIYAD